MDKVLKEEIRKIQTEIHDLNCYINNGGCICFVRIMAEQLYYRNIKYSVVIHSDNYEYDDIKKCFKNKNFKIDGVFHVLLKVEDEYFDGLSFERKRANQRCIGLIHPADLKLWETAKGAWNPCYLRKKYNPIITKIVEKHLKNYDKIKNRSRY